MLDIHCHILPGVDDGAANMQEAINMALTAYRSGIKAIIATPHYIEGVTSTNLKYNHQLLEVFRGELARRGIDIRVFLGDEVFITPNILSLLSNGEISSLNGSRYILLELPRHDIPIFLEDLIYMMRIKGLVPIIAHPERNNEIIQDPNTLYRFIVKGSLAQLNISSMGGKYGAKIKRAAKILLEHNMIHFLATDAHSAKDFSTVVKSGLESVVKLLNKDELERLMVINPRMVLEDKLINIEEPKRCTSRKKLSLLKSFIPVQPSVRPPLQYLKREITDANTPIGSTNHQCGMKKTPTDRSFTL